MYKKPRHSRLERRDSELPRWYPRRDWEAYADEMIRNAQAERATFNENKWKRSKETPVEKWKKPEEFTYTEKSLWAIGQNSARIKLLMEYEFLKSIQKNVKVAERGIVKDLLDEMTYRLIHLISQDTAAVKKASVNKWKEKQNNQST